MIKKYCPARGRSCICVQALALMLLAGVAPAASAQNTHTLPLVLPVTDSGIEGFVRIVNRSDRAGTVRIHAIDDNGGRFGPVTLALGANDAVNFRSRDLRKATPRGGCPTA